MSVSLEVAALRRAMDEQGLSQAAVAARAGVSASTLSRILDGRTQDPHPRTVERIRAAVQFEGLSVEAFSETQIKKALRALQEHRVLVERWSQEISFRDLARPRILSESFVDLHVTPSPPAVGDQLRQKISDIVANPENGVLLGDPGAGKTTSLKYIARAAINRFEQHGIGCPLLVRLRELGPRESIVDVISVILRIETAQPGREGKSATRSRVLDVLEAVKPLLLVDGLDELPPTSRHEVVEDLKFLFSNAREFQVYLTTRRADYLYQFENVRVWEIQPLDAQQVRQFAELWIGRLADDFASQLLHTPFSDTVVRPLSIAHLCAIYMRMGRLPENPRTIYRKIVRLLLEEWDEQRVIQRHSRYSNFEIDRKEELLSAVAYELSSMGVIGKFSHDQLEHVYHSIAPRFGLPLNDARKVARELESHTGLITEEEFEQFSFAHKSIQEYLTAEYLIRLPWPPPGILIELPNECAIATALSSDATAYLPAILQSVATGQEARLQGALATFLDRMVVERAYFRPSSQLGWTILGLAAYVRRTGANKELAAGILRVIGVREGRTSIGYALDECEMTLTEAGSREIHPRAEASLPNIPWLFAPSFLPLEIDSDFVGGMNSEK